MNVLGLNAFHPDSSAAIVVNGEVIAAVEEERFCRIKHWAGFPIESIKWCLQEAGLSIGDVNAVALNTDSKAHFWHKIAYICSGKASPQLILEKISTRRRRQGIAALLDEAGLKGFVGKQIAVEHHMAHLAACYMVSGFEDATVISVDGFGDFCSAAWGSAQGSDIDIQNRVFFPHSLGVLYQAITQYLGFVHYGDEYKVMGLNPYGEDNYSEAFEQLIQFDEDGSFELNLSYFRHHSDPAGFSGLEGAPSFNAVWDPKMEELFGPRRRKGEELEQRHMDIARSLQVAYENAFHNILKAARSQNESSNLCLAGGCGMNSVANGKIKSYGLFDEVYIQPAAGDSGGAIGAAMMAAKELNSRHKRAKLISSYLGPGYSDAELMSCIEASRERLHIENAEIKSYGEDDFNKLADHVATAIADGKVIGWFQGRQEWGARALGNRSILADARRSDMKDILNLKIKMRESFRPFAPSILKSEVENWFEEVDEVPFMMKVYPIKEERRAEIPAVTHVDGSGRLQTVSEEQNKRYHQLISAFFDKTGVPLIVNTSFNENEPIVTTPEQAMDCFLRTKMDVLVLGNNVIER